jgi:hypothetical protein
MGQRSLGVERWTMKNDDAWRWLSIGLALILAGLTLLRLEDQYLFTMWGIGLITNGSAVALVGTGVLFRLWR